MMTAIAETFTVGKYKATVEGNLITVTNGDVTEMYSKSDIVNGKYRYWPLRAAVTAYTWASVAIEMMNDVLFNESLKNKRRR